MDYDAIYSDVSGSVPDVDYDALYTEVQKNPTSRVYTPPKGKIKQDAKNLAGGFAKAFSGVGNTIETIGDALTAGGRPKLSGTVGSRDADRREAIDSGLESMGVNRDSGMYSIGKIGGEVLATAPIPAATATAVSKYPLLSNSIKSGGFRLGGTTGKKSADWFLRSAGGGVAGGSIAAVNPDDATAGVALGALTPPAIKGAAKIGSLIPKAGSHVLGATTGSGQPAIVEAFKAGKNKTQSFLDSMRNFSGFEDVVAKAKQGIANMRAERGASYRSGMHDISKDKAVLSFEGIDKAVLDVAGMGSYKGVQVNKNASDTVNEVIDVVNNWKSLDPSEYHTPEGLDALKRSISDIRDTTQYGTAGRKAVDRIYNTVKDEITKQAPTYAKVMKDYSIASETLAELEKSLSLGDKSRIDTAVRKLQSVMRNNASTNYGNRLNMVEAMENQGGVSLMPDLAGQSLNSWMPRGMTGAIGKAGAPVMVYSNPATAALLPFGSPRLMGEAAYGAGSLARGAKSGMDKAAATLGLNGNRGLLGVPPSNYLPIATLEYQRRPR